MLLPFCHSTHVKHFVHKAQDETKGRRQVTGAAGGRGRVQQGARVETQQGGRGQVQQGAGDRPSKGAG